jgi:hypothetical protein
MPTPGLAAAFGFGFACAFAGGCATTSAAGGGGGGGYCSIGEPAWASAARDFDRATTLEIIAGLRAAAESDRTRARTGQRAEVGAELDELARHHTTSAFISHGTAELATRLRQLDCAVRAGRVEPDRSGELYARILGELIGERAVFDPGGGGGRVQVTP